MTKIITLHTKPIPLNQKFFISRGRNILSSKYRDTKYALAHEMRSEWQNEAHTGTVAMHLTMYFGDKRKRDIDAYLKILLDAGEGILYENDNQIEELHVYRKIDITNPRVELTIITN